MANPNFIVPNLHFDLQSFDQEERERFEEMVQGLRDHREEIHQEWNMISREAKDDAPISNTAKKYWAIEWALSQIGIMSKPIANLNHLDVGGIRHQLETITLHEPQTRTDHGTSAELFR